jgi:hypothetical protein
MLHSRIPKREEVHRGIQACLDTCVKEEREECVTINEIVVSEYEYVTNRFASQVYSLKRG